MLQVTRHLGELSEGYRCHPLGSKRREWLWHSRGNRGSNVFLSRRVEVVDCAPRGLGNDDGDVRERKRFAGTEGVSLVLVTDLRECNSGSLPLTRSVLPALLGHRPQAPEFLT